MIQAYQGVVKKYALFPTGEAIGKSLGRNAKHAFVKHSLQSETMREPFFTRIHRMVAGEMKRIVRDSTFTVHVEGANGESLKASTWKGQYTTYSTCPHRDPRCLHSWSKFQKSMHDSTLYHNTGEVTSQADYLSSFILHAEYARKQVCVILYLRNLRIQLTFSFLKQVYTRIENIGLCLSSKSTWKLLEMLGMRHDDEVMELVAALQVLTPTSHVSRPTIIELAFRNM